MNCPECRNDGVFITIAQSGFGSWYCHCGASGTYPPEVKSSPDRYTVVSGFWPGRDVSPPFEPGVIAFPAQK